MIFKTCPEHLYIHWPFCSVKCHYCDFVALEQHEAYQDEYQQALLREISTFEPSQGPVRTIFLGGGTPSLYPLPWITELFTTLRTHFDISGTQEITIETNPADIDEERLDTWRDLGINRLSMGVQCLDDDVLLNLGRRQRSTDVLRAMKIAPKYFDNISIDLILGLPGLSQDAWFNTLETVLQWPLKHISIYFLTIHEKTPLYFKVERGAIKPLDDDTMVDIYQKSVTMLESVGIMQYEISNFAREGFASLHNTAYWNRKPYRGFGLGSSSFNGTQRGVNEKNLQRYIASPRGNVPMTEEILTQEQEALELLMLGLRQKIGMDLHSVVYLLSQSQKERFMTNVDELVKEGFLQNIHDKLCLTTKGMPLENEIIKRLL